MQRAAVLLLTQVALTVFTDCTTRHWHVDGAVSLPGFATADGAHFPPACVENHLPPTSCDTLYFHHCATKLLISVMARQSTVTKGQ